MQPIALKEKHVSKALFQFIAPFSLKAGASREVITYLEELDFNLFRLSDMESENAYYGNFRLNHSEMETYFLPLTANILFPIAQHEKGFQRYSKQLSLEGDLNLKDTIIPFKIHSIDIVTCPFDLGFLTIRTEIRNSSLSNSIEFANCMRRRNGDTLKFELTIDGDTYQNLLMFLINQFCPDLSKHMNNDKVLFLEKKNMYVQSLLSLNEEETIDTVDLYRFGTLCSYDTAGKPFVNANNMDFISQFIQDYAYDRFAPTTNYIVEQNCFAGITTIVNSCSQTQRFYGFYYYALLLNLFHKLVLLKIASCFSAIHIEQDKEKIESLNYTLNSFTSNYFYTVYPLTFEGQEMFRLLRKSLGIDPLYANTKEILFSIVKYEDNNVAKKDSMLLLVLTIYTVICGIFSMNLFTHDLQGHIKWDHFKTYNPFEYFAVFIVFSGMIVVLTLTIQGLIQGYKNRKKRKKWVRQTVWSSKKNG
ncbi:hypothetical protein [Neobacillus cucumis]|uniref:Group-specific protein n=1 Tax=Neobacillus cucumis TaxID=1740721 RepID=A0A2N5HP03_9BACI|nr:hypothetical protein [Neobacillus cucumis]PLS07253.1 hypothetical protein CVD27_06130 [Neobacillus cucumis]